MLLHEENLLEMALSRLDAMDRCIAYGEKFCEHFNLICKEGKDSPDFNHHCGELQGWFRTVKKIKTKHNSKELSNDDLYDWFFTAGSNVEDVVEEKYITTYKSFVNKLLTSNNILISNILEELI